MILVSVVSKMVHMQLTLSVNPLKLTELVSLPIGTVAKINGLVG